MSADNTSGVPLPLSLDIKSIFSIRKLKLVYFKCDFPCYTKHPPHSISKILTDLQSIIIDIS